MPKGRVGDGSSAYQHQQISNAQDRKRGGTTRTLGDWMTDYVVQNTTSTGITLSSGDTMEVQISGIASNTTILSGGLATVFKDGITVSTTISSGGLEIVSSAAQANFTRVSSGGVLSITSEGHALSTTVL